MIGNRIKTVMLLTALGVLCIGIGSLFGTTGMIIGLLIAFGLNFGSYWFSDKIILRMHNAKEVKSGRLYDITKKLAPKAGVPMPKVYMIEANYPNAFATGRSPKKGAVAATSTLLHMMSDEEVEGVMAHELAHIKHRDTLIQTIAVGIATGIAFIAEMFQWMAIFGFGRDENDGVGSLIGVIALAIIAPIIAMIIQMAISRQREFMADRRAAQITGTSRGLISALQNLERVHVKSSHPTNQTVASMYIYNPFKKMALSSLFSTHPPTSRRIEALKKFKP
ncbi:MAG: M48 family metalloprotease [Nanoarchaeota archaeon]|nr:M48 family metalloprotease [Nanoarchaeota archaeon]